MNTKINNFLSALFLSGFLFVSNVLAQESIKLDLKELAKTGIINVPAGTDSKTPLDFYVVLKGNVTSQIGVEAQGPTGITAIVEAAQMTGNVEKTFKSGRFWKVQVGAPRAAAKVATRASTTTIQKINCSGMPAYLIDLIIKSASNSQGRQVTEAEICESGMTSGNIGSAEEIALPTDVTNSYQQPTIDQSYGAAVGVVQKDNCSKIKNYLVRIRVSLEKVSAENLAKGFLVAARIQEAQYKGGRAASLKPVSDGMYAPRPLLMMQSLGGEQWINMVSWKGNKPKILKKVKTSPSIVYYRGFVLTRTVADSLLGGGRGEKVNFEATNGQSIYNVCGQRARVRWRINGYPGG